MLGTILAATIGFALPPLTGQSSSLDFACAGFVRWVEDQVMDQHGQALLYLSDDADLLLANTMADLAVDGYGVWWVVQTPNCQVYFVTGPQ